MMKLCPRCMQKRENVHLDVDAMSYTCMGFFPKRDEEGRWHYHDENAGSARFSCRGGCEGTLSDTIEGVVYHYYDNNEKDPAVILVLPPTPRCWCGWPTIPGPELIPIKVDSISEVKGVSIVNTRAIKKDT